MEFDFIGPNEKPAMVLLSTPGWHEVAKTALAQLGYKVHTPASHDEFSQRFGQVQYQVVITERLFAAATLAENLSLLSLQRMTMGLRRHAVVILIGHEFESLNAMQAFQQSVHAVINPRQLASLAQIVQQAVAENDLRLGVFRDTQLRIAKGAI